MFELKEKYKRITCLTLVFVLVFSLAVVPGYASKIDDKKRELQEVKNRKVEIEGEMASLKHDCDILYAEAAVIQAEVDEAQGKIDKAQAKVNAKEKEMKEREDGLNSRLATMYKNGSVGFIDVLLGSGSISEFISNLEMIKKIYKADTDVLKKLKEEHEELEKIKQELVDEKKVVDAKKAELDAKIDALDSKLSKLAAKKSSLESDANALTREINRLANPNSAFVGGDFIWPCSGYGSHILTSLFGLRDDPFGRGYKSNHSGVDIAISYKPVYAAAAGKVILAEYYSGYGNCIMIDHGGGIVTVYGHLSKFNVSAGKKVSQGQQIAVSGNTGDSTGPHLHFEFRENGTRVDPFKYYGYDYSSFSIYDW